MSKEAAAYPQLDLTEDYSFQKKTWRVQRIGWIIMALAVVLALFGGFGSGLLSRGEVKNSGNLRVEYERIMRYENVAEMKFTASPIHPADSIIKVWISRDYIGEFQVEQITPEPESNEISSDRISYTFRLLKPGENITIECFAKTDKVGFLKAAVGIEDGQPVEFTQFIFP